MDVILQATMEFIHELSDTVLDIHHISHRPRRRDCVVSVLVWLLSKSLHLTDAYLRSCSSYPRSHPAEEQSHETLILQLSSWLLTHPECVLQALGNVFRSIHAQMSVQMSAQIFRSVHRCSDQLAWMCLCVCGCGCVLWVCCVCVGLCVCVCVCVVCVVCVSVCVGVCCVCCVCLQMFRSMQMPRSMLRWMFRWVHTSSDQCTDVQVNLPGCVCVCGCGCVLCVCVGVFVCLCVWACLLCMCLQMFGWMQLPRCMFRWVLRSVHRSSDEWTYAQISANAQIKVCGCVSVCVCGCVVCVVCVSNISIIIICIIINAIAKQHMIRGGTSKCKMANYGFRGQEPFDPKSDQRPRSGDGCLPDVFSLGLRWQWL